MRTTPAVSVITPTYNQARYIPQCVQSVLSQSRGDWEQIIIDDGSSDGTLDAARCFRDPRIKVISQSRSGIDRLASTYNRALAASSGDYIAILEGDDFWQPSFLGDLLPAFENPGIVMAYGLTTYATEKGVPVYDRTIPSSDLLSKTDSRFLNNEPIGAILGLMADPRVLTVSFPCSVLIRRRPLVDIGGFQHAPGLPFTDYPTFLRLASKGLWHFNPETGGFWRQRLNSATRTRDEVEVFERLHDLLKREIGTASASLEPHLPPARALDRSWAARRASIYIGAGRRLLLLAEWKEARRMFLKAILSPYTSRRRRVFAVGGLVAAMGRRNVEAVARRVLGPGHDLRELYASDKNCLGP